MCTITQSGKKYKKDKDIKPNECAKKTIHKNWPLINSLWKINVYRINKIKCIIL